MSHTKSERERLELEKLGREADRAVWAVKVAEHVTELVLRVVDSTPKWTTPAEVRRRLAESLSRLVATYEGKETETVKAFVDKLQKKAERESGL